MLGAVVLAAVLPAWAPPRVTTPRAAVRSTATAASASRRRHAAVRAQQQQQPSIAQLAQKVVVDIATTGINSRCITASIVVGTGVDEVWQILTDYDNLATHVPNLVQSARRPHPTGGIRLFQEGAQNIIGFDFRASLTMDMTELTEEGASAPTRIAFELVDSAMFAAFDGEWRVLPYSRVRSKDDPTKYDYKSKLSYLVNITPKGLVPVPALEWQIREEVPTNLRAVRRAAELRVAKAKLG